ncbi:Uma2 family endonuclease [Streptomyces sp. NPDC046915]|uniref:Uma2 family endonuclease n=1 Tax=Streptomyces sp. NPDC046915 TaxID=3155257 RepID=UPI0033FCB8BB
MSAASVEYSERPACDSRPMTLTEAADLLRDRMPGYLVEVIGGQLLVTPPPDGPHGDVLTDLTLPFLAAGLHGKQSRLIQGIGLALPEGPEDYAVPDLSLVDADYREHRAENGCYDPACFRLVLEVTSNNYQQDLRTKVATYAKAMVPVYVIVDRKHQRLHVLTGLTKDAYATHRIHAPGEVVTLPEFIGAKVSLDVRQILKVGEPDA